MMPIPKTTTQLRLVVSTANGHRVNGLLLVFETKELAMAPFNALEDYFSKRDSDGFVAVAFDKDLDQATSTFTWVIDTLTSSWTCTVAGVSDELIEDVLVALQLVKYGFVLCAYFKADSSLQILFDCNYNFSQILVNGTIFRAQGSLVLTPANLQEINANTECNIH
jgi:hypothetical protein